MVNPAAELADIYDAWRMPSNGNAAARQKEYAAKRGMSTRQVLSRAMGCLIEIESALTRLREAGIDVSIWEAMYPVWQKALTNVPQGGTGGPREALSPDATAHLRTFGVVMDAHSATFRVNPETQARISAAVQSVRDQLPDLGLSRTEAAYAASLLDVIEDCLNRADIAGLRAKLAEFVGWTTLQEATTTEPSRKEKFAGVRQVFLYPFLAGVSGDVAAQAIKGLIGM